MTESENVKTVERLFPFVKRARLLIVGRPVIAASKSRLHFVLVTEDLSENSLDEILRDFAAYPVVRRYRSEQLEAFFGVRGAKVIGFRKSGLAQSIYAEMKQFRLNKPSPPPPAASESNPTSSGK